MHANELKAWRKARALSQADAARLLQKSRASVQLYEQGRAPIPDDVAAMVRGEAPQAEPDPPPKVKAPASKAKGAPVSPIEEALQRKPLFAKTSAEAKLMREALHARAQAKDKEALLSRVPLIPLQPDWQTVQTLHWRTGVPIGEPFKVNAAIPDPTVRSSRHPRGVCTKSGVLYDYETAEPLRLRA